MTQPNAPIEKCNTEHFAVTFHTVEPMHLCYASLTENLCYILCRAKFIEPFLFQVVHTCAVFRSNTVSNFGAAIAGDDAALITLQKYHSASR